MRIRNFSMSSLCLITKTISIEILNTDVSVCENNIWWYTWCYDDIRDATYDDAWQHMRLAKWGICFVEFFKKSTSQFFWKIQESIFLILAENSRVVHHYHQSLVLLRPAHTVPPKVYTSRNDPTVVYFLSIMVCY